MTQKGEKGGGGVLQVIGRVRLCNIVILLLLQMDLIAVSFFQTDFDSFSFSVFKTPHECKTSP